MNLQALTNIANSLTDEAFPTRVTINYANQAISEINTTLNCNLPYFIEVTDEYTALSENWLRLVLVPYICFGIKKNDVGDYEASPYYQQFMSGLTRLEFNKDTAIHENYQGDNFDGVVTMDTSQPLERSLFNTSDDEWWF